MIHQTPSFSSLPTDPPSYHLGVRDDSGPVVQQRPPIEEIVAEHTAIRPSRALCAAYGIQSIATGAPLMIVDLIVTGASLLLASSLLNYPTGVSQGIWIQLPVS